MGMLRRSSSHGVIEILSMGLPSSPIGVRVRSTTIFRVFSAHPAQRTVPSVPGSFATLESPSYGVLPMKTHTYGVSGPLL